MPDVIKKIVLDKLLYQLNIKNRLIAYFLIVVIVPITIVSYMLFTNAEKMIGNKIYSVISNNLFGAVNSMSKEFLYLNDNCISFNLNPTVKQILSKQRVADEIEAQNEISELDNLLDGYFRREFLKLNSAVLTPSIYVNNRPLYNGFSFSERVFDISKAESEGWLTLMNKERSSAYFGPILKESNNNEYYVIKYVQKVYDLSPTAELEDDNINPAMITVDLHVSFLESLLKKYKLASTNNILVLNKEGVIAVSTLPDSIGKRIPDILGFDLSITEGYNDGNVYEIQEGKKGYLLASMALGEDGWRIVSVTPESEFSGEYLSLNKNTLIIILLCLVIAYFLAMLLAGSVTSPIKKLVKSMNEAAKGKFDISINYKGRDEYAYLIDRFKSMLKQIEDLFHDLYTSEMDKQRAELVARSAELEALQAQINPHFLYNTLNSIFGMAADMGADDIATMVKSLSDFFRYNLSKGKTIIRVEDEICHLESYLRILKYRMGERLKYRIEIDDAIKQYSIVKLILQPLAENAIIHGLEELDEPGEIVVSGYATGDTITFIVSDNGKDADVDEINALLYRKNGRAYGIRNVNERIKHAYGQQFGLEFRRADNGSGVAAVVKIPIAGEMEEQRR